MDTIEAIRVQAALDILEGGFLYHYRRICRWYSQTFHTPLPQVEALHEDDVLRAFFETQFESMGKSALKKQALEMTESDEETKARKRQDAEKSDEAFIEREAKKAAKENKKLIKKLAKEAAAAAAKVKALSGAEMAGPVEAKPAPPPEISMNFSEEGNLLDEECIPVPPPRKR